jgi:hypothetical protein
MALAQIHRLVRGRGPFASAGSREAAPYEEPEFKVTDRLSFALGFERK